MFHIQTQKASKEMKDAFKQLVETEMPFASALTLTKTAQAVKKDIEGAILRNFDNPTPYTQRSVFMKAATKQNQEAIVWIKEWGDKGTPAAKFLLSQVYGGERKLKGSEKLMQERGIMKPGETWTPGMGAKVNQYGNITGGQIQQILSAVGAQRDKYQNSTDRSKRKNKAQDSIFFAQFGSTRGVFKKGPRGSLSMLLRFSGKSSPPAYRVRLPINTIAAGSAERHYEKAFYSAVQYVIATRK